MTWQRLLVPLLLGLGIVTTLGREIVFANSLGVSRELEVFRLAFSLPNMLSQSLAPAFIGALMPALIVASRSGQDALQAFHARLSRVSLVGVIIVSLIGVVTAGFQASLLAPGFDADDTRRLAFNLALCWGFFALMALSFRPRLLLNHGGVFWPGSSTSVVISLSLIAASLFVVGKTGADAATVLSYGAIAAAAIVLSLHWLQHPAASTGEESGATNAAQGDSVPIIRPLLFVFALHTVNTLPRFIDRAVASELAPGAVAAMDYSFNVITVPGILLGTSVITVFYPVFARAVGEKAARIVSREVGVAVVGSVIVALIAGYLLHVFAFDLVGLIYARGQFGAEASQLTGTLLSWHALGLGAMVLTLLLFQGCLAYQAYGLLLAVCVARLVSKWLAVEWLVPRWGLDGLGASFIVPEVVSAIALAGVLAYLVRATR